MDPNIESATVNEAAQDIQSRVEESLFGKAEPEEANEEVVSEDAEQLPEDDDTDSEDDEGSKDLEDIADAEEDEATLATYLGVDEDRIVVGEDGTVSLTAVIDGESKNVPLSELAKSFQLQGHVNNKSMALETERKEFEAQRGQVAEELKTRIEGIDQLGKAFEQQLVEEYNSIDWDRLRAEDASEWTALRQEYAEKAQKLQKMQALVAQEGKRLHDEQQAEFEQQRQAHLQSEMQKMLAANPAWQDRAKMDADMTEMRSFLKSTYSFSDEDMQAVTDHRLVQLIQDAKAYRSGKKTAETKKAKVVPKFQKPGAAKANADQLAKARNIKAKRAAVKKSGNVNDVAKFLEDRM